MFLEASWLCIRDRPKYHYRLDNSWRLLTKFFLGKSYMGYMILAGWLFWVIKRSQTRSTLRIAVAAELHMLSSFRTPSMLFHVSCLSAGHGCVLRITLSSSKPLFLHHTITISNFKKITFVIYSTWLLSPSKHVINFILVFANCQNKPSNDTFKSSISIPPRM